MSRLQELIAYHEAGHAVAAVALGIEVREVTIVPAALTAGSCELASTPDEKQRPIIDAAGVCATELYERGSTLELNRRLRGRRLDPALFDVAASVRMTPIEFVHDYIGHAGDGSRFKGHGDAHAAAVKAYAILVERWASVVVLSDELLNCGVVSGVRVREICHNLPVATMKAYRYDPAAHGWKRGGVILPAMTVDAKAERRAAISKACQGTD